MENRYGRTSELNIEISNKDNKTILSDAYFTPPFKIMKPFYENDLMRILQMSASPGVMEGDCQTININIKENSKAEIYSQSYEKIHKMDKGDAKRNININAADNCFFVYNPLPVIPYAGSAFNNEINVNLSDSTSVFVYSDIITGGRIACGECFKYRYYNSLVCIYENNNMEYRDNTRYAPHKMNMAGIGLYEGYTHLLGMVICNINIDEILDDIFEKYMYPFGITKTDSEYVVIRALGNSSQELQWLSDEVKKMVYNIYTSKK